MFIFFCLLFCRALSSCTKEWRAHCQRTTQHFQARTRLQPAVVWWQLRVLQRSAQRQRRVQALGMLRRSRLLAVWESWREVLARGRLATLRAKGAVVRWRARVADRARRALHSQHASALDLSRRFQGWVRFVSRARALRERADSFHKEVLLARVRGEALARWSALIRAKTDLKRHVLRHWRRALARRVRQRDFVGALWRFEARACLRVWFRAAARAQGLDRAAQLLWALSARNLQARLLAEWSRRATASRALSRLSRALRVVHARLAQRRALHVWHRLVQRDCALEQMVSRFSHRCARGAVQRAVSFWRHCTSLHGRKEAQRLLLASTLRQHLLSGGISSWRGWLCSRRAVAQKSASIAAQTRARLVNALWLRWHEAMYSRSFLRYESGVVRRIRARHALRRWGKRVAYRSAMRSALVVADAAAKGMLLKQCLVAWRRAQKVRRYKLACVEWMAGWVERRAAKHALLQQWRPHAHRSAMKEVKLRRLEILERVLITPQHTSAGRECAPLPAPDARRSVLLISCCNLWIFLFLCVRV